MIEYIGPVAFRSPTTFLEKITKSPVHVVTNSCPEVVSAFHVGPGLLRCPQNVSRSAISSLVKHWSPMVSFQLKTPILFSLPKILPPALEMRWWVQWECLAQQPLHGREMVCIQVCGPRPEVLSKHADLTHSAFDFHTVVVHTHSHAHLLMHTHDCHHNSLHLAMIWLSPYHAITLSKQPDSEHEEGPLTSLPDSSQLHTFTWWHRDTGHLPSPTILLGCAQNGVLQM